MRQMLICSNCGSLLETDSLFCEKCGQRIDNSERKSSNELKTPITTINSNIKPTNTKIIISKTILFLLVALTLDTIVIGLNWIIYEYSKVRLVTTVTSSGTITAEQSGPIDTGLGFTLIILLPLIIGIIQVLIYNYEFSDPFIHLSEIERIVYFVIPIVHITFLIYFFSLIASNPDLYYVVNTVVSCEIFIGIFHIFRRITKFTPLFNNGNAITDIGNKETEKRIKADNIMLLNVFELRGGKKG